MRGLVHRLGALAGAVVLLGCSPSAFGPAVAAPRPMALPPPIAVVEEPAVEVATSDGDDPDKDGIKGAADECPDEPETYNGLTDEDGCPDKSICNFGPSKITIADVVYFDDKGAKIASGSLPLVEALATTLQAHPEIELVEVEGHSDERGDEKVNLALTEQRAKIVMDALVAKGVAKDRLRAKGFGEYCPRDPAHDEAAWALNRRVSFRLAKVDGQNNYEELGCAEATAKGVVSSPVP